MKSAINLCKESFREWVAKKPGVLQVVRCRSGFYWYMKTNDQVSVYWVALLEVGDHNGYQFPRFWSQEKPIQKRFYRTRLGVGVPRWADVPSFEVTVDYSEVTEELFDWVFDVCVGKIKARDIEILRDEFHAPTWSKNAWEIYLAKRKESGRVVAL